MPLEPQIAVVAWTLADAVIGHVNVLILSLNCIFIVPIR